MEYLITVVHNHKMNDFLEKGVNEQRSFLKSLGCVSFGVYRNIFLNQFNLKFKLLKEDCSNKCDTYATTLGTETVATKEKIQQEYDKHPEMVTIARDTYVQTRHPKSQRK